jgi:hypothetical protein
MCCSAGVGVGRLTTIEVNVFSRTGCSDPNIDNPDNRKVQYSDMNHMAYSGLETASKVVGICGHDRRFWPNNCNYYISR